MMSSAMQRAPAVAPTVSMAARRSMRGSSLRTTVRKARAMSARMQSRTMATATSGTELASDVEAISESLVRHFQCTLNEDPAKMGDNAADTYRALAHTVAERLAMRFKKTQDAFVAVRVPPFPWPCRLGPRHRVWIHHPIPTSVATRSTQRSLSVRWPRRLRAAALGPLRHREDCTRLSEALVDRPTHSRWRLRGRTAAPTAHLPPELPQLRSGPAMIAMCAHCVASHLPLCVCQCRLPPPRHHPVLAAT